MRIDEKTKKELVTSFIKCRFNPKKYWTDYSRLVKETGIYVTGIPSDPLSKPKIIKARTKEEIGRAIKRAEGFFGIRPITSSKPARPGGFKNSGKNIPISHRLVSRRGSWTGKYR